MNDDKKNVKIKHQRGATHFLLIKNIIGFVFNLQHFIWKLIHIEYGCFKSW